MADLFSELQPSSADRFRNEGIRQAVVLRDWAAESIAQDGKIRLPFGAARTSPVDSRDVAEVIATVLAGPAAHIGKVDELIDPRSEDMFAHATKYAKALNRTITYVNVPLEKWRDEELRRHDLPEHVYEHMLTMAKLHAAGRYDRLTQDVEAIIGRAATSTHDFVARQAGLFK